jgi:hypothetical protein
MDLENEWDVFTCSLWTQEDGPLPQLRVDLSLDGEWEGVPTAASVLAQIVQSLPFENLDRLHVRELHDWDDPVLLDAVRDVIPQLVRLRLLHLGQQAVGAFLCGLSRLLLESPDSGPTGFALPQLRQLHIELADLSLQVDKHDNAPSMLELLGLFLEMKRRAGHPPPFVLIMWQCQYEEIEDPTELEQHVRQELGDNVAQIIARDSLAPFPRWAPI